jgi:hypothetical protein
VSTADRHAKPPPQALHPAGIPSAEAFGRVTIQLRHGFAVRHRNAAGLFRDLAAQVEAGRKPLSSPTIGEDERGRHEALVVGSYIAAAAYLEATINETLSDAGESPTSKTVAGLDPKTLARLYTIYEEFEREAALRKYTLALAMTDRPPIPKGDTLYQHADLVLDIRNALVHFKPKFQATDSDAYKIESRFQKGLGLNPFTSVGNPFFPDKCMSAACVGWALDRAIAFVLEFRKRLGVAVQP